LVASVAAVLGFIAGVRMTGRRSARLDGPAPARRRRRDELCECGVVLPRACTVEERERHAKSNRHKRNMNLLGNASEVVVCEEVSEYRAAAQCLVRPDDWVLEVGCHVGGTTKVLASCTQKLIGIDQQPDLVAQARQKLPNIRFEILDAFEASKVLALVKDIAPERFKKVFIDISGSRDIATVVRLMDIFENTLRPEHIVVKSQALKRFLLRGQLWIHHPSHVLDDSEV